MDSMFSSNIRSLSPHTVSFLLICKGGEFTKVYASPSFPSLPHLPRNQFSFFFIGLTTTEEIIFHFSFSWSSYQQLLQLSIGETRDSVKTVSAVSALSSAYLFCVWLSPNQLRSHFCITGGTKVPFPATFLSYCEYLSPPQWRRPSVVHRPNWMYLSTWKEHLCGCNLPHSCAQCFYYAADRSSLRTEQEWGFGLKSVQHTVAEAMEQDVYPQKNTWKSEGNRLAEEGRGQEPEGIKR